MTSPVDATDEQMDTDNQNPKSRNLPYYGTKRYNNTVQPTLPSAKTLGELFEEYKQFSNLKKKDEMGANPEAGTAGYLISCSWMNQYMTFILFSQFKNEVSESNLKLDHATHFEK